MYRLKKIFANKGSVAAYAIISVLFTVTPEELYKVGLITCDWTDLWVLLANRSIVCIIVFLIANLIYWCYRKHRYYVIIADRYYSIKIEFGDLLDIKDGKKVVNFDECYSTHVGDKPEDIKPNSVCGQYLQRHPIQDIQRLIQEAGIKPIGKSKYNSTSCYEPGTVIHHGQYLLMAFTKLDKGGLGRLTYDEYVACLNKLWKEIDRYHGTEDVYLPILGSRIVRFDKDLTQQDLLDIMISSYRLSPYKLRYPYKLHIVCKERKGFSLNDIFGVEQNY